MPVKATFALLTDIETFNLVSKISWQLHRQYGLGVAVRRLPPHVSLKQPFDVDHLDALDDFLTEFAQSLSPCRLELAGVTLWEVPPHQPTSGVLTLTVHDDGFLGAVHDRLNRELAARFADTQAPFDGTTYTFHLTIASGTGSVEAYRDACAALPWSNRTFETRHLALFVYDQDSTGDWQYLTYKVVPLGMPAT